MPSLLRQLIHRFVPAHLNDPLGLARRLWKTGDPAAKFAMGSAALGIATTPFDLAIVPFENRFYRQAPKSKQPQIFVCGGPRTGTTLAAQVLIQNLPCSHFTNLTALFSRSPILATRVFGRWLKHPQEGLKSFYGRTTGLLGISDALNLWDRWLGKNRLCVPEYLDSNSAKAMQEFFAAWESAFELPLIAKCNNLNATAHLVADELDNSFFICLTREPLYMAQSLYEARLAIHGELGQPYGLSPAGCSSEDDVLTSVCTQVQYHEELAQCQAERIGSERFWTIPYEQFCANPEILAKRVGREILGLDDDQLRAIQIPPLRTANRQRLDGQLFNDLRKRWEQVSGDKLSAAEKGEVVS